MVGTLTKKWDKWYIIYNEVDDATGWVSGNELPVHPDDCWLDTCDGNEGAEYEFAVDKITKEDASGKRWSERVAKLIGKPTEEHDLWICIYNDATDRGITTMTDFVKYLKENYKAPVKVY
jgi:hypothetical protein